MVISSGTERIQISIALSPQDVASWLHVVSLIIVSGQRNVRQYVLKFHFCALYLNNKKLSRKCHEI